MTLAEQVAARLGDDGQQFETPDGTGLADLCAQKGAVETRGRTGIVDGERVVIWPIFDRTTETLWRYEFSDGSAIVATFDCWDTEGDEPFSFAGT